MHTIELRFHLPGVLALAEHAAATAHEAYGSHPPTPALIWARMNGTLLMSSGRPRTDAPDVYAEDWGPGTGQELARTPVGGDDFGQTIPLSQPVELTDGRTVTLLEWLREHSQEGTPSRWFVLEVTAERYDFDVR
ncbi:hypothetical protein ACIQF6_35810 [Kitasatospora sp. NPDC092948]|uniref:hypothetical protein n=1 Tax=Kitasatospora sp. NPDC092948 TaxID=3364088 RepID=UPI00380C764E